MRKYKEENTIEYVHNRKIYNKMTIFMIINNMSFDFINRVYN